MLLILWFCFRADLLLLADAAHLSLRAALGDAGLRVVICRVPGSRSLRVPGRWQCTKHDRGRVLSGLLFGRDSNFAPHVRLGHVDSGFLGDVRAALYVID